MDRLAKLDATSYLAATYHLDKETQTKTGSLQEVYIDNDQLKVRGPPQELGYGVLSIKDEGDAEWSIGGSDGGIHMIKVGRGEDGVRATEV